MPAVQPTPLKKAKCVKLVVGVVSQGDLQEVVMPLASNDNTLTYDTMCQDAVNAFIASGPLTLFKGCMGSGAFVRFISAEMLILGGIPYRLDFGSTVHPGTLGTTPMPSSVAGLMVYYAEGADLLTTERMRVGKTFMPGVPMSHVTGDFIDGTLKTAYEGLAQTLLTGFITIAAGGNWYRVLSGDVQQIDPTNLIRSSTAIVRNYVATQRRRMVPH